MFKRFVISGTKNNDDLPGTGGLDIMFGKKGNDTLHGLGGNDFLFGGKGNDQLFGGDGNDKLFGGKGNDFLDGGAGSDYLLGGKGDDTFNFTLSENVEATDFYDGGKGFDTLQLTLTTKQFEDAKAEIEAFKVFLAGDGKVFQFESFGLKVRDFEDVKVVLSDPNSAPTAVDDLVPTDEDSSISGNVLANDNDAEDGTPPVVSSLNGAAANVGATITLASGALLTVNMDGTFTYDPNGQFEGLGAGQPAEDSFTYVAQDSQGVNSEVATVKIAITGVNDDPVANPDSFTNLTAISVASKIDVAVIGGAQSSFANAVSQLDNTLFNAQGFAFASEDWSSFDFSGFDVVVLGGSGTALDYGADTGLFEALHSFVASGGGVVTTGFFAIELRNIFSPTTPLSDQTKAFADAITPIAPGWTDFDLGFANAPITVADPTNEIVRNVALDSQNVYLSNAQFHEFAPNLDVGATQLATGTSQTGAQVTAVAYDVGVGQDAVNPGGRTVYVGATHLANSTFFGTEVAGGVREGVSDQIFEQAIAWAAGARGSATVSINPADLFANDTDVDSPSAGFSIESFTQPGEAGASIALVDGILVYTLGAQGLADLQAGVPVTDSFDYTLSDGNGGFDVASVSLTIDNLL